MIRLPEISKGETVHILGIESSCDETAAAVVEDGRRICSNVISSQVKLHAAYGGVVPEIASRRHLEQINLIIEQALDEAGLNLRALSAVAVSSGPGLVGALLVGVSTAKALAYAARLPLIAVNHVEAHLYANFLTGAGIRYPLVALIASGGHTSLLLMPEPDEIVSLGQTRDDAAGEVFDKVARAMGLGYPGGPLIDRLAAQGNPAAIDFPRAYLDDMEGRFDFSFSGLKSAVINHLHH
ncbi:MAG TPA: tRNA (adenosine(37)-N6)-threonylcarbamoyltransferase complex transferase subunit TsaD, partial [Bacillota bacterium]|nr:tRNA (adenosine(37)-N6)-threonylcarbamoyltransferase complex transferase subunit TsaD [Bacillota bacterium]HQE11073.1 tRNA (adenosine(37)-N6)-threonylcarbamoyltransferase complex transferase subunit TsaD [Bacillota bacterium]